MTMAECSVPVLLFIAYKHKSQLEYIYVIYVYVSIFCVVSKCQVVSNSTRIIDLCLLHASVN